MSSSPEKLTIGDVIRARVADTHLRVFARQTAQDPEVARRIPPRHLVSRAELRDLLRANGLAKGAAERVADAGWRAIDPDHHAADLAKELREATAKIREAGE